MKIKFIQLNNIGLYKNNKITFPSESEKSLILFWGNNGAGKTTLINSIKIALLGKGAFKLNFSDYCDFIRTKMISTRCDQDKIITASITIEIEIKENNRKNTYQINRAWRINSDNFDENVSILSRGKVMDFEQKERVLGIISRLLPPSLLDVIIFDGESAINILNNNQMNKLIKGIIFSVFGMDVYAELSKDLNLFLRSRKSNSDLSSQDQYEFVRLENDYKTSLNNKRRLEKILDNERVLRTSKLREINYLTKRFTEKTGVDVSGIEKINDSIENSELEREKLNSEIRFINEEILPLKLVHARIKKILNTIDEEKPFYASKYIKELRLLFFESYEALNLIKQLESYMPNGSKEVHYYLSESEYEILKNSNAILERYSKKDLLEILDNKNDFIKDIRKQIAISNKIENQDSKDMIEKLEKLYEEVEVSTSNISKIQKEIFDGDELLTIIKKNYDNSKESMTKQKKESSSYVTAMMYRDSIDSFISENIDKICAELNKKIADDLLSMGFRNNSIKKVTISTKTFDLELYENTGRIIPSSLFSAGEKQVLLGLLIKEALSILNIDTFFLFDTPVGRLDVKNRNIFTKEVIFNIANQVAVFATDSDYSRKDYFMIKDRINEEVRLVRNEADEIIVINGGIYDEENAR